VSSPLTRTACSGSIRRSGGSPRWHQCAPDADPGCVDRTRGRQGLPRHQRSSKAIVRSRRTWEVSCPCRRSPRDPRPGSAHRSAIASRRSGIVPCSAPWRPPGPPRPRFLPGWSGAPRSVDCPRSPSRHPPGGPPPPHDGAFAPVPVAAAAEDRDHPACGEFACGLEGPFQRVRGVGVVHHHAEGLTASTFSNRPGTARSAVTRAPRRHGRGPRAGRPPPRPGCWPDCAGPPGARPPPSAPRGIHGRPDAGQRELARPHTQVRLTREAKRMTRRGSAPRRTAPRDPRRSAPRRPRRI